MAKQDMNSSERQGQPAQGQEVALAGQPPRRSVSHSTGYPLGYLLQPGEFFRISPFALVRRMSEEMDRAFEDFAFSRGDALRAAWSPAIELSERDRSYVIRAELPGLKPEDVKVEMTEDAIVLQGERKLEHTESKDGVRLTELQYGRFYRSLPLPEGAEADKIQAKFENGILEITVPLMTQPNRRREIRVEAPSAAASGKAA